MTSLFIAFFTTKPGRHGRRLVDLPLSIIEFHRGRLWAEGQPHSPTGSGDIQLHPSPGYGMSEPREPIWSTTTKRSAMPCRGCSSHAAFPAPLSTRQASWPRLDKTMSGCLVLDMRMTGMSGLDCFDQLRERRSTCRSFS